MLFGDVVLVLAVVTIALVPPVALRTAIYVVSGTRKRKLLGLLESIPRLAATPAAEAVAYKYGLFRAPALARRTEASLSLADVLAIGTFALVTGACTTLVALMVVHPDALAQPMVLLSGQGFTGDVLARQQRMANFYAQTFAAAYLWALFHLLKQLRSFSLTPLTFLESALHVVVALFVAFVVGPLVVVADSSGILSAAVAVVAGVHEAAVGTVRSVFRRLRVANDSKGHVIQSEESLGELVGVDDSVISELKKSDVENLHALATSNPFLLYVETSFSLLQILDWVGQAQLMMALGTVQFERCKELGIRTVFDLVQILKETDSIKLALVTSVLAGSEPSSPVESATRAYDKVRQSLEAAAESLHVQRLNYIYTVYLEYFPSERKSSSSGSIAESHEGIEQRVISAISSALAGPVLTQYEGWIQAQCAPAGKSEGKVCVAVRFFENRPEWGHAALVKISEGERASAVEFDLELNVGFTGASSARATVTVPARGNSMVFYLEADRVEGEDKAWVQVFQQKRLIQVVSLRHELGNATSE